MEKTKINAAIHQLRSGLEEYDSGKFNGRYLLIEKVNPNGIIHMIRTGTEKEAYSKILAAAIREIRETELHENANHMQDSMECSILVKCGGLIGIDEKKRKIYLSRKSMGHSAAHIDTVRHVLASTYNYYRINSD